MRRLPPILYFVTSLATLFVGSASSFRVFNEFYTVFHEANRIRVAVADATLYFATPVLFLLAAASSARAKEGSKGAIWITAAAVPVILSPLIHYGQGWKLYAEEAGSLISVVFALWPLVSKPPVIAAVAAATYAFTLGDDSYLWFRNYWIFGGSPSHLLLEITTPTLVIASACVAIASYFVMRKETLSVQANSG